MVDFADPCATELSRACFTKNPKFAKQAFAFRLLSLFFPSAGSKLLQKYLRLILLEDGATLPDGIVLPAGTVVFADVVWPADWESGDALPAGVILATDIESEISSGAITTPDYLSALPAGVSGTKAGQISPTSSVWFNDNFTTLNTSIWSVNTWAGATFSIVSGRLKYRGIDVSPNGSIDTFNLVDIPQDYDLEFKFEVNTDGEYEFVFFGSGYALLFIEIHPHATLTSLVSATGDTIIVDQLIGSDIVYLAQVRDTTLELFLDGVSILSAHNLGSDVNQPGELEVWFEDAGIMFLDYLKITSV